MSGYFVMSEWIPYLLLLVLLVSGAYWLHVWLRRRARDREERDYSENWQAGRALIKQKKWQEAVSVLDKALTHVGHRPEIEAQLHFHKGYALEGMERLEEALSEYTTCQVARATLPPSRESLVASFRHGYLLSRLERWDEAVEKLQQAAEGAAHRPIPELRLNALRVLLGAYQATQRHAEAIRCAKEALRVARDLRDEATEALILDMAGDVRLAMGQTEDALRNYEQSLDMLQKLDHRWAELVVKRDIGKLYQASGEWDKARTWLHACLLEEEHAGNVAHQARICYDLACLHFATEELDEAAAFLHQSASLFRRARDNAGVDQVGRTLMGLGVLMYRQAASGQMTFQDIERGLADLAKEEG